MAQSVSNDALWEKLSEVDKKLKQLFEMQRTLISTEYQQEIKIDFGVAKDDIISEIKEQSYKLGNYSAKELLPFLPILK